MILFKKANDLRHWLETQQKKGSTIGFVPTMGALHEGHISLVRQSLMEHPITVVSIFVNPTQFNDPADFAKYPVTIEKDIALLAKAGCHVLFLPSVAEMYPEGLLPAHHYPLGFLETVFEGQFRPGHFQGVSRVVDKLLQIVKPHSLFMGQKDYQQCMVIRQLLHTTGHGNTALRIGPTLREKDGLAMSSRNTRLSSSAREKAPAIFEALTMLRSGLKKGDTTALLEKATHSLEAAGLKPEYVALADAEDLTPVTVWDGEKKLVGLIAAYLGEVRLIDNMLMNPALHRDNE